MALQDFLEFEGFHVDCVPTCRQAFSSIEQNIYNAVLLDLELPDGNGCSILEKLQVSHPSLPVIILTASIGTWGPRRMLAWQTMEERRVMRDTSPCYRHGVVLTRQVDHGTAITPRDELHHLVRFNPNARLKTDLQAEITEGIFKVRIQPLDRAHLRIRDIFHCQRNPFLAFSERRDRMPELVTVENHHIAGTSDQLEDGAAAWWDGL